MSLQDEEFDMLGEDELALLTQQFERMHENRVNMRRNMRTCFQCGKPGHFIADCPEKVENKDSYKHKSKTDGKYRSRRVSVFWTGNLPRGLPEVDEVVLPQGRATIEEEGEPRQGPSDGWSERRRL
jgi:hypothetical protein